MRHGSLFSGIGGFDLAARWMGWDNVFHVEWNPWCRKVLEYHFPQSQSHNDVKQFDGTAWRGKVDIISGGFPCQPYSAAGKRMGKEDERHLWPEMLRIIREAAPAYVVGENVRGLTNWNGGVVFEEVCADLEAEGYEVWTGILPAAGVGAPHRRDRVWFVARHTNSIRQHRNWQEREVSGRKQGADAIGILKTIQRDAADTDSARAKKNINEWAEHESQNRKDVFIGVGTNGEIGDAANTDGHKRRQRRMHQDECAEAKRHISTRDAQGNEQRTWANFPTQPPVCGGDDGLPRELDGITFSKWRNESIKAYGNAIVPQVAYQIFNALTQTT